MKPLIVLLDMDGVITNILKSWVDQYNAKYGESISVEQFAQTWDVHNHVPCGGEVYDIMEAPEFFLGLDFMPGAEEGMIALKRLEDAGRIKMYIVSNAGELPHIAMEKLIWLNKNLPWFEVDQVVLTAAKELVIGDILVEDSVKNIKKWKVANPDGHVVMMAAPHNKSFVAGDNMVVTDNWSFIVDYISFLVDESAEVSEEL